MNVLITGITGFVGSWLAEYIVNEYPKVKVYGFKRWRSSLDNIRHILDKVTLIDGDLLDLPSIIFCLKRAKPDKVFHLAAQTYVPYSFSAPIITLLDNAVGTANLLEAIRITEQNPLVHICSSSEVYGQVSEKDLPIKETQPLNPVSPYGVSKVAEDLIAKTYFDAYKMKIIRTRMFTHTGPRQHENFVVSNFAKQIAMLEKDDGHTIYVGNLTSIRTIADVRDTVRAYWLLNDSMIGEVYNIGGNSTVTIAQLLMKMGEIVNLKIHPELDKNRLRPTDVTLQIPDCSKFRALTSWQSEIPIETTLKDILDYWRARV